MARGKEGVLLLYISNIFSNRHSFLSSFLSGRSIAAVVDGHCSAPNPINSSVPQGSVLSPTLFLLFTNLLYSANCPIHSYADDITLHYSMSFDRQSNLQELQISRIDTAERLTSDLSVVFDFFFFFFFFFFCNEEFVIFSFVSVKTCFLL